MLFRTPSLFYSTSLNLKGKVKHAELPVVLLPAVAFTAFAEVWPPATETEIGTALSAIGAKRTLSSDFLLVGPSCLSSSLNYSQLVIIALTDFK